MSIELTSYSDCPKPVFIQQRPKTNYADIWLRRNIVSRVESEDTTTEYIVWEAEEAYGQVSLTDLPDEDEILDDFDSWFEKLSTWEEETNTSMTADERLDELYEALDMILRGVVDDETAAKS